MKRIIILDDMTFDFTDAELERFVTYWNAYSKHSDNTVEKTKQIAKDFKMTVDNTFLVILYLARKGWI